MVKDILSVGPQDHADGNGPTSSDPTSGTSAAGDSDTAESPGSPDATITADFFTTSRPKKKGRWRIK
jgi:hypothetical protein